MEEIDDEDAKDDRDIAVANELGGGVHNAGLSRSQGRTDVMASGGGGPDFQKIIKIL